ncbi:MAG: hypothetical protein Q9179_007273 [Wetmoreana sp. 5 TL-2023]
MPDVYSRATFDLHFQAPPKSAPLPPIGTEPGRPYDELAITFNKTLEGHYRHGKTGYQRVVVLFLTWEEDDMQCKGLEVRTLLAFYGRIRIDYIQVDALRNLFENRFHYETKSYEIPKTRWQTGLQKEIADLYYDYDSPDNLVILYYGGHGYVGGETESLKLAAKVEADASGDPTAFMNDILGCCRLPACDQLLILDCCYAANAFGIEHIGKRKFEMIVSSGSQNRVPAPDHPGSFTKTFTKILTELLDQNKDGFITSQLYRKIYHSIPPDETKPWLFDQARRDYGRIVLRPQLPTESKNAEPEDGRGYLNLTLKLNKQPDSIAMNQLALGLQYLPHVEQVRFEKLWAPRKEIEDFMLSVRQAVKLRPFVQRLHARRRMKALKSLPQNEKDRQRPESYVKLWLDQKQTSTCDWSSALEDHNPSPTSPVIRREKKSSTWPTSQDASLTKANSFSNPLFSLQYKLALPTTSSIPELFQPRRAMTIATSWIASVRPEPRLDSATYGVPTVPKPSTCSVAQIGRNWRADTQGDELWHALAWLVLWYALGCFCFHLKE